MSKKTVLIMSTGGTIAAIGESGKSTGYVGGGLSPEMILNSVPGINNLANIKTEQICNVNSNDVSGKDWLKIAKRINELDGDSSVDGFVVTHGTDTIEETSYFMNLVCKTKKPVVFTGSMRPSTSLSADGPMNLYQSVLVAVTDESFNKPVMVVMNDHIHSARTVQKGSTYLLDAISSPELGILGYIRSDSVFFINNGLVVKNTSNTEFDISDVNNLVKVNIVYYSIDADIEMLEKALEISDGVVIACAGEGGASSEFREAIDKSKIPVVISSRSMQSSILEVQIRSNTSIPATYLNPQKAAVLLKVALSTNPNRTNDELKRIFAEY